MANNKTNSPLDQLKAFLNKLFQFESQDLDFGVYKILNYKQKEIKEFIERLLVEDVKNQLQSLTDDDLQNTRKELNELEKSTPIKKWMEAIEKDDLTRLEIYEEDYRQEIRQYKELQQQIAEAGVSVETENLIYNHLSLFFSRYYDKGDFISKRRFGKNEKYVVPYNGEETHFYWANHDQYYIKSSETFQKFSFKINQQPNDFIVHFKLTEAEVEQGNVKADENKFFILAEKEPELEGNELTIFFEYRAMTDAEKKTYSGNNKQDKLDEDAAEILQKKLKDKTITARLWETKEEETFLLKKLHHYTRKNKYDFFIHKNLKAFLQRELDFYIKSELLNVDDLYVSESDAHFENIRHNLKTIRVFKHIADTITDFLAQIEDFQKKLWEKKKFVLSTEWVITIDRLLEYVGEEDAQPILKEVIRNTKQVEEWKELFGKDYVPGEKLTIENLKVDLHFWRKLPIDTVHFNPEFKLRLLDKLSAKIDLDEKSDGLVIHSDNYHGLKLLFEILLEEVKLIYIDPPFNLGTNPEYVYKVDYKNSSWLSLLEPRLKLSRNLLNSGKGSIFLRCNHDGNFLVRSLLNLVFGHENFRNEIIIRRAELSKGDLNKQFSSIKSITVNYDNIYWYSKTVDSRFERFLKKTNPEQAKSHWHSFWKAENRPNLRYEILGITLNRGQWMWKKERAFRAIENYTKYLIEKEKTGISLETYWEKTGKNLEFVWKIGENNSISSIKYWIPPREFVMADNNWLDIKGYSNSWKFKTENSEIALKRIINSQTEKYDLVLDYFLGSGTTISVAHKLGRKWIGIEAGQHFYDIVLPRMKKVLNGDNSGISKHVKFLGGGFFKYQRLEQYEEALENIAFSANENIRQKTMDFKDYIPKYFLEFETRNSQTLVNTEAMQNPWNYRLKVWDGFTYDNQQPVDLVETFNYLIGLHMQKYFTKEIEGVEYRFVLGNNNAGKQIAVVWRNIKDWKLTDFEKDGNILKNELQTFTYDLLYVNGQAHLDGYQPIEEVFKNKMLP